MSSPTNVHDVNANTPKESQSSTTETETEELEHTETSPKEPSSKNNAATENGDADSTAAYNPSVSDEEDNEQEMSRIKGDAIGGTLYSERFVLSTLLQLSKLDKGQLADDETFEKNLCALWDMTIEEDVVELLLQHQVLELFAQCIEDTDDRRLTEILVGIAGNMCSVETARSALCEQPNIIATLLQLISCSDTLTLVQLMRLLAVVLVNDDADAAEIWFRQILLMPEFVEHLSFVLQNSVNATLLAHALEALNAMAARFSVINKLRDSTMTFSDIFVCESLICGTLEAFKVLLPPTAAIVADEAESTLPSAASKKTTQIFLNIHAIFAQFKENAENVYAAHMTRLQSCLAQLLQPLCLTQYLLPLSSYEQDIIENVDEIYMSLGDPYDAVCLTQMISIWHLIESNAQTRLERSTAAETDFEADDVEPDENAFAVDMCMSILYFVTRMVRKATDEQLDATLRQQSPQTIRKLVDALRAGDSEDDIKQCCQQLNKAFERLNQTTNVEADASKQ